MKLSRHTDDSALLEGLLDRLASERLQSDARHAEAYVHARAAKGYGPVRIAHELRGKGVAGDVVEQALAALDMDWRVMAQRVRRKRFGSSAPGGPAERARQMKFLEYRGFPVATIRAAMAGADDECE